MHTLMKLQSISERLRLAYSEVSRANKQAILINDIDLRNDYCERIGEIDALLGVFIAQIGHDIETERRK